jgi:hypothetical protein
MSLLNYFASKSGTLGFSPKMSKLFIPIILISRALVTPYTFIFARSFPSPAVEFARDGVAAAVASKVCVYGPAD